MDADLSDLRPPPPRRLVEALRSMVRTAIPQLDLLLEVVGQVDAAKRRAAGKRFRERDHVRGLVLAQLAKQRPWPAFLHALPMIHTVMHEFDPRALEKARMAELTNGIFQLNAGNRSLRAQMSELPANIETLGVIAKRYRSLDRFVTSAAPAEIARKLSGPREPYKLRHVGRLVALDYLRNVGIPVARPDVHILRVLGSERLGYLDDGLTLDEVLRRLDELADQGGVSATELDNLVWLFGARSFGGLCKAKPVCGKCELSQFCRWPHTVPRD